MFKFSNPIKMEELLDAYIAGMPKVEDLKDCKVYSGHCRNASKAMWLEEFNKFVYIRKKFGDVFLVDIEHPQNDRGFDLFITEGVLTTLTSEEKEIFDLLLPGLKKWMRAEK